MNTEDQVFRSVCPRNCYGTCGMLSTVRDGRLIKVSGDPGHGYTKGRLCAKGYAYTDYVYHPERLRYPLWQNPRGSGHWQRISWDKAYELITGKILELNQRYNSNRSLGYNKFSGNLGLLHYAAEGMFNSLGAHTKITGNPCLAAGIDAIQYDCGEVASPDPESMAEAQLIVMWGVNPAWTAIQQLSFVEKAREQGAKVVVIDPLFTPTAGIADLYLQIRPGTDGLLALAIIQSLLKRGAYDREFVANRTEGWQPFERYVTQHFSLEQASEVTGIFLEGISELATLYEERHPCANWVGYGMQRHTNGGQSVRAIDALTGITGNLGVKGGGLFYHHPVTSYFPMKLLHHQPPVAADGENRFIDLNNFAREALALEDPPLKFLWIACRNPLSQDVEFKLWEKLLEQLELVVTVDLFMTHTAKMSDLVLPATSPFEALDINVGYWHRWVGLNEKVVNTYYESKSDLQIAQELTRKLNQLSPNFSNFPSDRSPEEWVESEFTPDILESLGIADWRELYQGPRKLQRDLIPWQGPLFKTASSKFNLFAILSKEDGSPALPIFIEPKRGTSYPLRLITPQRLSRIHSQYGALNSLSGEGYPELVEIHPRTAEIRKIKQGDLVTLFNEAGSYLANVRLNSTVPVEVVVGWQGGETAINGLIHHEATDMGAKSQGTQGMAYYDIFVEVEKNLGNAHG